MFDAVATIHSFKSFGKEPGLQRIKRLLELLGNPQSELACIHVAGTNGKGSVCCYLSHILRYSGLKTGLFISPYVLDFRERFQINGEMISQKELEELTMRVRSAVDLLPPQDKPTQFDFITAIAFLYFKRNGCDAVILETGLGGLYDATNIIEQPLCTVITSISMDHTAVLGDTIEKIATQKAGIIKQNGKTVVYPLQPPAAERILQQTALEKNNRWIVPDMTALSVLDLGLKGSRVCYKDFAFSLQMCGSFQPLNAVTAIEAACCSGLPVNNLAIREGLEQSRFPARCEVLGGDPPLLLDGAHNPDGLRALSEFVRKSMPRPVVAVMGMMADKDAAAALKEIASCFAEIFCVKPNNPRALPAEDLTGLGDAYTKCTPCDSVTSALKMAQESGAAIVICGSLYLAAEARNLIKGGSPI